MNSTLTYARAPLCPASHHPRISTASAFGVPTAHRTHPDLTATALLVATFVVACGLWLSVVAR